MSAAGPAISRGAIPWHPVVLAGTIVVSLWVEAAVSPFAAIRSLVIALGLGLALTVALGAATRSLERGAIGASLVIGLLWTRQLVELPGQLTARIGVVGAVLVGIVAVAVVVLAARIALRSAATWNAAGITVLLNRASLLLLVAAVALGLVNGRLGGVVGDLDQGLDLATWRASPADDAAGSGPDIYAILLDGYPRADVLEYAFDIDNAPFLEALEDRGFEVAAASHSDYLWTHVSLPSALNMAFVEQIPAMLDVIEGRRPRQPTLRLTVTDNAVFDAGRESGYTPVAVGAGFEEVSARRADVYVDGGQLNEFEISLLVSTWAGDLVAALAPDFASAQQRDRISYNLDVLAAIAETAATEDRGPILVFDHIPAPHQPVVFGEDGAAVEAPLRDGYFADSPQERGEDPREFRDRYRSQLPYLNERILAAIDAILAVSSEPPVIVLFADHGSASEVDWNATTPEEADPARLLERTGILFAALTPGHEDVFPDDVSPADLFRLLFDAYAGTDYGRVRPPEDGGHVEPVDASVLDR